MVFGTDFKQGFIFGAVIIIIITAMLAIVVYGDFFSDDTVANIERDAEDILQMEYVPYRGDIVMVSDPGGMNDGQSGVVVSRAMNGNAWIYSVVQSETQENGEVRECGYNKVGPPKNFGCWTQGYRWNEIDMTERPDWAVEF